MRKNNPWWLGWIWIVLLGGLFWWFLPHLKDRRASKDPGYTHGEANGRTWKDMGEYSVFYLTGFKEGRDDAFDAATDAVKSEPELSAKLNKLSEENIPPTNFTMGNLQSEINKFYEDRLNTLIPISFAQNWVVHKMEGASPGVLQTTLINLRQYANELQSTPFKKHEPSKQEPSQDTYTTSHFINGRMWNKLDSDSKLFWVGGFEEGKAYVIFHAGANETESSKIFDKLEKLDKPHNFTMSDIVSDIDKFYEDTSNSLIPVTLAREWVIRKMRGATPAELLVFLVNCRNDVNEQQSPSSKKQETLTRETFKKILMTGILVNGKGWKEMGGDRVIWLVGFEELISDRVPAFARLASDAELDELCGRMTIPKNFTSTDAVSEIDKFYQDPSNIPIAIIRARTWVILKMKGATPVELQEKLVEFRRYTKEEQNAPSKPQVKDGNKEQ
jgi:hypothetical protein